MNILHPKTNRCNSDCSFNKNKGRPKRDYPLWEKYSTNAYNAQ